MHYLYSLDDDILCVLNMCVFQLSYVLLLLYIVTINYLYVVAHTL
jgi:hypothetical protein